jgi:hypothetical protein
MPAQCCKDFFAKLPDDEPVFTLAARDRLAPEVVDYWIKRARAEGVNEDKLRRSLQHFVAIVKFQRDNPERVKLPD